VVVLEGYTRVKEERCMRVCKHICGCVCDSVCVCVYMFVTIDPSRVASDNVRVCESVHANARERVCVCCCILRIYVCVCERG